MSEKKPSRVLPQVTPENEHFWRGELLAGVAQRHGCQVVELIPGRTAVQRRADRLDVQGRLAQIAREVGAGQHERGRAVHRHAAVVQAERRIAQGGELPLNTNGGQLSGGRLHGHGFLHEACVQLWGEGDARQVAGARVGVAAAGGGPIGGCLLIRRE